MRSFAVAILDMYKNVRKNFVTYLLITLGIASSLLTHVCVVGVIDGVVWEKSQSAFNNTVSVKHISADKLGSLVDVLNKNDVVNAFLFFEDSSSKRLIVGWYGNRPANWFPLGEGRFIEKPHEAYVSSNIVAFDGTGTQQLEVGGKQYCVVGTADLFFFNLYSNMNDPDILSRYSSFNSFVFLPLSEALQMNPSDVCLRIQMQYNGSFGKERFVGVIKDLRLSPDADNIEYPANPLVRYWRENAVYCVFAGIICLLTYSNMIAVYCYALKNQERKFSLYSLNGATPKQIYRLISWKFFFMYSWAFLISFIVSLLLKPLWKAISLPYQNSVPGFLFVYLWGYFGLKLLCLPIIRKLLKPDAEKWNRLE